MKFFVTEEQVADLRPSVVSMARGQIDKAGYCYLSENCRPPDTVNCAVFVKWLLDQHDLPAPPISKDLLPYLVLNSYAGGCKGASQPIWRELPGDLVFFRQFDSRHMFNVHRRIDGRLMTFSHVGVLTENKTVIHACGKRRTVVEDTFRSLQRRDYEHVGTHSLALELCLNRDQLEQLAHYTASDELRRYYNGQHFHCISCYYALAMVERGMATVH